MSDDNAQDPFGEYRASKDATATAVAPKSAKGVPTPSASSGSNPFEEHRADKEAAAANNPFEEYRAGKETSTTSTSVPEPTTAWGATKQMVMHPMKALDTANAFYKNLATPPSAEAKTTTEQITPTVQRQTVVPGALAGDAYLKGIAAPTASTWRRTKAAAGELGTMLPNMVRQGVHAFTDEPKTPEEQAVASSGAGIIPGRVTLAAKRLGYDPQVAEEKKAKTLEDTKGRTLESAAHRLAGLIPMAGPLASQIGEQAGTGDIAGAATKAAGYTVIPKMMEESMPGGSVAEKVYGTNLPIPDALRASAEYPKSYATGKVDPAEVFPTIKRAADATKSGLQTAVRTVARHPATAIGLPIAAALAPHTLIPLGIEAGLGTSSIAIPGISRGWSRIVEKYMPEKLQNLGLSEPEVAIEKFQKLVRDAKEDVDAAQKKADLYTKTGQDVPDKEQGALNRATAEHARLDNSLEQARRNWNKEKAYKAVYDKDAGRNNLPKNPTPEERDSIIQQSENPYHNARHIQALVTGMHEPVEPPAGPDIDITARPSTAGPAPVTMGKLGADIAKTTADVMPKVDNAIAAVEGKAAPEAIPARVKPADLERQVRESLGGTPPLEPNVPLREQGKAPVIEMPAKPPSSQDIHIHGERMEDAVTKHAQKYGLDANDLRKQIHGVTNAELGELASRAGVDMQNKTVGRAKGNPNQISRPELFNQLIDRHATPQTILDLKSNPKWTMNEKGTPITEEGIPPVSGSAPVKAKAKVPAKTQDELESDYLKSRSETNPPSMPKTEKQAKEVARIAAYRQPELTFPLGVTGKENPAGFPELKGRTSAAPYILEREVGSSPSQDYHLMRSNPPRDLTTQSRGVVSRGYESIPARSGPSSGPSNVGAEMERVPSRQGLLAQTHKLESGEGPNIGTHFDDALAKAQIAKDRFASVPEEAHQTFSKPAEKIPSRQPLSEEALKYKVKAKEEATLNKEAKQKYDKWAAEHAPSMDKFRKEEAEKLASPATVEHYTTGDFKNNILKRLNSKMSKAGDAAETLAADTMIDFRKNVGDKQFEFSNGKSLAELRAEDEPMVRKYLNTIADNKWRKWYKDLKANESEGVLESNPRMSSAPGKSAVEVGDKRGTLEIGLRGDEFEHAVEPKEKPISKEAATARDVINKLFDANTTLDAEVQPNGKGPKINVKEMLLDASQKSIELGEEKFAKAYNETLKSSRLKTDEGRLSAARIAGDKAEAKFHADKTSNVERFFGLNHTAFAKFADMYDMPTTKFTKFFEDALDKVRKDAVKDKPPRVPPSDVFYPGNEPSGSTPTAGGLGKIKTAQGEEPAPTIAKPSESHGNAEGFITSQPKAEPSRILPRYGAMGEEIRNSTTGELIRPRKYQTEQRTGGRVIAPGTEDEGRVRLPYTGQGKVTHGVGETTVNTPAERTIHGAGSTKPLTEPLPVLRATIEHPRIPARARNAVVDLEGARLNRENINEMRLRRLENAKSTSAGELRTKLENSKTPEARVKAEKDIQEAEAGLEGYGKPRINPTTELGTRRVKNSSGLGRAK